MAKTNDSIKKIQLNFLDFLKQLTGYLNNTISLEKIIEIINKHEVEKTFLFKRLFAYNYNTPYLIWYINKYMNDKYQFYNYDIKNYLSSFRFIMQSNNIKKLYFFKANDFKDNNKYIIKNLLKEYFLYVHNKFLNNLELNHLYLLFCKQEISLNQIEKINKLINGEKSNLNIDQDLLNSFIKQDVKDNKNEINNYINYQLTKQYSENIFNFILKLNELKKNSESCQKCKLFNNNLISFDTNIDDLGEVDFMFIGLNSDKESLTYNKVFFEEFNQKIREQMFNFDKNIKWVMCNIIQCNVNYIVDIGKTDKQILTFNKNCSQFINLIIENFPAKIYIPIGKHPMNYFNIPGTITQNSGKINKINNKIFIPMINPKSFEKNEFTNLPVFNNTWDIIYQISNKLSQKYNAVNLDTQEIQNIPKANPIIEDKKSNIINKYNISSDKIINEITSNLTYFDSVNLDGNTILNIYIDENSQKFYKLEEFKIPIYIKNKNYNECNMLTGEFDYITYINGWNKYKLSKALKDNLIKHKHIALTG